jgi:hypothetical protein
MIFLEKNFYIIVLFTIMSMLLENSNILPLDILRIIHKEVKDSFFRDLMIHREHILTTIDYDYYEMENNDIYYFIQYFNTREFNHGIRGCEELSKNGYTREETDKFWTEKWTKTIFDGTVVTIYVELKSEFSILYIS